MKRKIWMIFGSVLVLIVLAGGAYTATKLVSGQPLFSTNSSAIKYVTRDGKTINYSLIPAEERPEENADAQGVVLRFENDNLIVGTGEVSVQADPKAMKDGKLITHAIHSGPEVEIVVTPFTTIYVDATDLSFLDDSPSGDYVVQEVLQEVETINEITENSFIAVWGERRGNRVIAEVIAYHKFGF